ncbi:MAG: dihydropteroate synthase [Marinosulfonomonas sp.]
MTQYFRPLAQTGPIRPTDAIPIAGGWTWFTHAERLTRDGDAEIVAAGDVPAEVLDRISGERAAVAGLSVDQPRLMGIVNVTPDSFSDGGDFSDRQKAVAHGMALAQAGADILDIGGESTRPGAAVVPIKEEIARTEPVLSDLRAKLPNPLSIDTRKHDVARAAVGAGARIVNDVSALSYDPQIIDLVKENGVDLCLMHAQGDPETMQDDPHYDNVLLDVYDYLNARVSDAVSAGVPREKIIIDPGIGFGKTVAHNVALLQNLSLFHGIGCTVLLGASRKRFIGALTGVSETKLRMPGSVAVMLAGISQGVQITRVHDISESKQALTMWASATGMRQ